MKNKRKVCPQEVRKWMMSEESPKNAHHVLKVHP